MNPLTYRPDASTDKRVSWISALWVALFVLAVSAVVFEWEVARPTDGQAHAAAAPQRQAPSPYEGIRPQSPDEQAASDRLAPTP